MSMSAFSGFSGVRPAAPRHRTPTQRDARTAETGIIRRPAETIPDNTPRETHSGVLDRRLDGAFEPPTTARLLAIGEHRSRPDSALGAPRLSVGTAAGARERRYRMT
jgi:hypothetical protein